MPVQPLYSTALVRLAAVVGVVVALAVASATAAALWAGRKEAISAAAHMTASLTRALTDAVARSVNSIDVTLTSVGDLALEAGLGGELSVLAKPVAQRLALAPHVRQILVVRADGVVLFDSAGLAQGRVLDIGEALEDLRRLPRALAIGAPRPGRFIGVTGKAAGQSLIPVNLALRDSTGAIAAVVMAAVNPEHFHALFHEIEEDTGVRIQLWRFDGVYLAGDPAGPNAAALPLFKTHLKQSEMGGFIDRDDDGVERVTAYRATLSWPLVVSVGLGVKDALANWRRNAEQIGWPVGLVTLALLALTVALVRTLARRARDEARLRLSDRVLSNVSNGVTIADASKPDLPLLYANQAFERITGYTAQEALGRNARFLHADEADQEGLDRIREALAEGVGVTVKLRNFRADGVAFWNQVSLSPVVNAAGVITHWVGVQRDVTQEEESRAALAAAYEDVARYSADLERFSFVLAHHLQEPARQMRLQAQMLLMKMGAAASPEDRGPADRIIEASARLVELLRDVQTYLAVEREPVVGAEASPTFALEGAVEKFSSRCPDGVLAVEQGGLPKVAMPQTRLDDLFDVLVENAVAFRHPDRPPAIKVSAESDGKMWLFRVADNGIGIEREYFERVFVPLERLRLRDDNTGTGIGLAVARKIVESVHGRIWVESDGVTGSTFLFTLPKV